MSNFRVLKMALAALAVVMSSFASHAAQTPVQDQTIRAAEEQPVATALAILTFAASIAKQPPEAHRICNKSL